MPLLEFPAAQDGLAVPVYIGVDGQTAAALLSISRPLRSLVPTRGQIDTGSDLTAVAPWVLQRLTLPVLRTATTQTAAGPVHVNVYSVSLSITDPNRAGSPMLTESCLVVTELAVTLADADVLVGLNFLLKYKLALDGPLMKFSLEF
jgi:hypothetical protein